MNIISNNKYINIVIDDKAKTFFIEETPHKPQKHNSALTSLKKIEKILNEELIYSPQKNDNYSKLLQNNIDRVNFFREKSETIHSGYTNKINKLSQIIKFIRRLFCNSNAINAAQARIDNELIKRNYLSPLFPQDVARLIDSNVPVVQKVVTRAQKLGYSGTDVAGATTYLNCLYDAVCVLSKNEALPKRYWSYIEGTKKINPEVIVQNLETLTPEDFIAFLNYLTNFCHYKIIKSLKLVVNVLQNFAPDFSTPFSATQEMLNTYCRDGNTPLIRAVLFYPHETVEWLLRNGANPNLALHAAADTPLHCAVRMGYLNIAGLLLTYGANVNAHGSKEQTPLHAVLAYMSIDNQNAMVRLLLENNADIDARDRNLQTPLHLAVFNDIVIVEELLRKDDIDLEAVDASNETALDIAARLERVNTISLLLARGATVRANTYTHYHRQMAKHSQALTLLTLSQMPESEEKTRLCQMLTAASII